MHICRGKVIQSSPFSDSLKNALLVQWHSNKKCFLLLSITIPADGLQVIHGLPLVQAKAIGLDVLEVVLGPLQPTAWDHSRFDRPLAAAMQHLEDGPNTRGDGVEK